VYPVNGHYEVFAGGNRLEAVKITSIEEVPVVLHEGYTEDEITGLADQDNENDEYHTHVPITDIWMDYKRLSDSGWTQQRIADAKGVSQSTVKFRLKFSEFSPTIIEKFSTSECLNERHARELNELVPGTNLAPWLDRATAMLHVINTVLSRTNAPTAAQFHDEVDKLNARLSW
jgi:ParB-like chromosome segregation protein Spo0J